MGELRVFRYRLPITDRPVCTLPDMHTVLSVGPSRDGRDELDLWAIVDPDAAPTAVQFRVVGTGHQLHRGDDESYRFLGTVPHADGALIFHVFEVLHDADG